MVDRDRLKEFFEDAVERFSDASETVLENVFDGLNRMRSDFDRRYRYTGSALVRVASSDEMGYILSFGGYVVAYGVLINYTVHFLLDYPFTMYTFPAYGITWYFVKEEVTEVLNEVKPEVQVKVKER